MKITNTSGYPTSVIRRIVSYVAKLIEIGDYVALVEVTGARYAWRGRCWGRRVLLRIGEPKWFPAKDHSYPGLKTAPKYDANDWIEGLVHVAAHELQHSRQFMLRTRKSEIEAERAALYVLNQFRKDRAELQLELDRLACEEIARDSQAIARRKAKVAAKRAPETKVAELQAKIARWESKRKLAETYIKKYRRALRYQERRLSRPEENKVA